MDGRKPGSTFNVSWQLFFALQFSISDSSLVRRSLVKDYFPMGIRPVTTTKESSFPIFAAAPSLGSSFLLLLSPFCYLLSVTYKKESIIEYKVTYMVVQASHLYA